MKSLAIIPTTTLDVELDHFLSRAEIAAPCDERWESMTGDDKVRICSRCDKSVYSIYSMNREEVREVLRIDQHPCLKLYLRADGTVLRENCPVGLTMLLRARRQVERTSLRLRQFVTSFILVLLSVAGGVFAWHRAIENRIADEVVLWNEEWSELEQEYVLQNQKYERELRNCRAAAGYEEADGGI